jgi:hypothetical protein
VAVGNSGFGGRVRTNRQHFHLFQKKNHPNAAATPKTSDRVYTDSAETRMANTQQTISQIVNPCFLDSTAWLRISILRSGLMCSSSASGFPTGQAYFAMIVVNRLSRTLLLPHFRGNRQLSNVREDDFTTIIIQRVSRARTSVAAHELKKPALA